MSIFRVKEMHDKFGFKALPKPGFLQEDIMKMRLNFLLEELLETAEACGYHLEAFDRTSSDTKMEFTAIPISRDLEKALDGLIDLNIVTLGTAHLMGFGNHLPRSVKSMYGTIWSEGCERVHLANMAKERVKQGDVGKRGSSHDLIKPKGWQAPEFGDLLA